MQQATHQRLHVRDAHDAHIVFEAVRQGFLPPVTRRLNDMERGMLIRSGAIFVWFERDDDSGLKRWTDGRVWGQSRMREPYLFYDEKMPYDAAQAANETNRAPAFRFVDGVARPGPSSSALSHQGRTANHHPGLVKQAYSAWVLPNSHTRPQKWHLTAYFTYADLPHLPTIDHDPILRTMIVPSGIYRTGKARSRSDDEDQGTSGHRGYSQDSNAQNLLPSLSTIHASVGPPPPGLTSTRTPGTRLPEDQRLIQMLNSRHVK
ncbi:cAMP-independent regulatory protein pac2 [Psilocybe cubensis]|uniref:cAMP-independent regulatory protein pac2 n=2 Tax=Psilocybe cubensis TaxID=181762 RepID=A0ACB8H9M1_PSICU|nr:cAMP-independent regulatory protein pac2 [Psilocybe cubensis]KAH9483889.1 cAMP-independent regulatory protein pac2 [Psilocybe cubensis]